MTTKILKEEFEHSEWNVPFTAQEIVEIVETNVLWDYNLSIISHNRHRLIFERVI